MSQTEEDYYISEQDYKLLNGIWWTIERVTCGVEEQCRLDDCQEHLFDILDRIEKQRLEKSNEPN